MSVPLDSHAVASAQPGSVLHEYPRRAIVHANADALRLGPFIALFQLVAEVRAADCAADRGCGVARAVPDLAAERATRQSADERTCAQRVSAFAHDLDGLDGAVAARGNRGPTAIIRIVRIARLRVIRV